MSRIASTEVVIPQSLSAEQRRHLTDALYAVHQEIFEGVTKEGFARYVVESTAEHTWIQLHRNEEGALVGYFALHVFEKQLGGVTTAVFRAEAGSLRAYRGGNTNTRFGLFHMLKYLLRHPGRPAYYLGALVHPSSYALFAKYCTELWPRREQPIPSPLRAFLDELGSEFGLARVDPTNPLLRQVGWCTRDSEVERDYWRQCDKLSARYFIEANPGYAQGHGLLTLAPVTRANIVGVLRVMCGRGLRKPVETAMKWAYRLPGGSRLLRGKVARQLKSSPLFAHFDTRALKALAARAQIQELPAGHDVFRQGEVSDELYLLARGAAYVLARNGTDEDLVNQLGSGTVFGELSTLVGGRRSATVRTAATSTVVRIPGAALRLLLEQDAGLSRKVWGTLAERLFDDMLRGQRRYAHLARKERRAWLLRGEEHVLAPGQELLMAPGSHLFMVAGAVELTHAPPRLTARGVLFLEVERPLPLVALEATRLVVLPRLASSEYQLASDFPTHLPLPAAPVAIHVRA
ncbi:cyclic nucleotide-binding domain-containing protein [Myxococcus sp. CA051A]|uniref:cyclic nucleotide-binding domain-containing protein n=1 Tax=Myxococcus sp. CA051A TaxID=2741739 RepID=UPI00157B7E6C|nr:cyclic nucleotide-binding domain-containing protein [Myxococcus sp. CA051A]NTX63172.1 cyclic nucleotide-binding domain-containing protein [Myxococcus sp. CA051A]